MTKLKIPSTLSALLEELEPDPELVKTGPGSHAQIYYNNGVLELNAEACSKLLQNIETVEAVYKAIGSPGEASIELFQVGVECDVYDALEELFAEVKDE